MQQAKFLSLAESYVPRDPRSLRDTLEFTWKEDIPTEPLKVIPLRGTNFMPTGYGYRSFFGLNSTLDITSLTGNCDALILWQAPSYDSVLIALTDTGVWSVDPSLSGATWTQHHTIVPSTYKRWTYCIIENNLYMYQEGESVVHTYGSSYGSISPTFLNMSGQVGIFNAGGRLGFWDSLNSVSWSSILDLADFTPAELTLAGNAIFTDVLGDIVSIKKQRNGFIIYAESSIVGVRENPSPRFLWAASSISDTTGIVDYRHVCEGTTNADHYAWTTAGLLHLSNFNQITRSHTLGFEEEEVFDFINEKRSLIRLSMVNARFLFIEVTDPYLLEGQDPSYVTGLVTMGSGSAFPSYPTYVGGFCLDTQLEKWGKYTASYKQLLDINPVNNQVTGELDHSYVIMDLAALLSTGEIKAFDWNPSSGEFVLGKIGLTRLGFTDMEEVILHFRQPATGAVNLVGSVDGDVDSLVSTTTFTSAMNCTLYNSLSAKWFEIEISGMFDLQYVEVRGNIKSRR